MNLAGALRATPLRISPFSALNSPSAYNSDGIINREALYYVELSDLNVALCVNIYFVWADIILVRRVVILTRIFTT